jgi:hypothetical protein
MSQFLSQNGGIGGNWLSIQDEDKSDLYLTQYSYGYQQRCDKQAGGGQGNWVELWSSPSGISGDPTAPMFPLGQDATCGGRFESQSSISRGMIRPYFIRGTVKDSGGTPVAGATVKGYTTVGDVFVGSRGTDNSGNYELPTAQIGLAHYLVAYNGGNNQAGTTVNTLTPVL